MKRITGIGVLNLQHHPPGVLMKCLSNFEVKKMRNFFVLFGAAALVSIGVLPASGATPASGTLTDANPMLTYTAGPFLVANVTDNVSGTPMCSATVPAEQCDTYTLTVNVASNDASTKQISISISFPIATGEFDVFVYNSSNAVIASDAAGGEPSSVLIPAVSGTYTIVVDPWNPLGQSFAGTVALQTIPAAPPPPKGYPSAVSNVSCACERRGSKRLGRAVDWDRLESQCCDLEARHGEPGRSGFLYLELDGIPRQLR